MATGSRLLLRQQAAKAAEPAPLPEFGQAVVTAVSAASPPVVTISYLAGSYQVPHLATYTPAVNDVVAIARYAGSYLIIGRPVGFP